MFTCRWMLVGRFRCTCRRNSCACGRADVEVLVLRLRASSTNSQVVNVPDVDVLTDMLI